MLFFASFLETLNFSQMDINIRCPSGVMIRHPKFDPALLHEPFVYMTKTFVTFFWTMFRAG